MQTNLLGRAAIAELSVKNPKWIADPDWKPERADETYWIREDHDVEIVGAFTTGARNEYVEFIVLDGNGRLHEVDLSRIRLAPPAHPFR